MKKSIFSGKNVILTGASSGIGREIAKELCDRHSCRVIGIARNEKRLEETSALIKNRALFTYEIFDVSVRESWSEFTKKNGLFADILINCAGILPPFDRFDRLSYEDISAAIDTNFMAGVYSIRELLPVLEKSQTPLIINISSSSALAPVPGAAMYSASKGAMKCYTEAIREELRGKVRVVLVCPGFSLTNIFRGQKSEVGSKLIGFVSTPPEKVAARIIKGVIRGKKTIVTGADAHLMSVFTKLFGSNSFPVYGYVMKKSGLKLFSDVFRK